MIVYPSSENKTARKSLPAMSLLLIVVAGLSLTFIIRPMELVYAERASKALGDFEKALDHDFNEGRLAHEYLNQALENPAIVKDDQFDGIFTNRVIGAYYRYENLDTPHLELQNESSYKRFFLLITPENSAILILAFLCLVFMGFVFEHIYHPVVVPVVFLVSGASWLVLDPYMDSTLLPSPIFAWPFSVGVLLFLFFLRAPNALITIRFRSWFFRPLKGETQMPAHFFLVVYLIGMVLIGLLVSPYANHFEPKAMVMIPIEAGVLLALLVPFPRRDKKVVESTESVMNKEIASAHMMLSRQQEDKAVKIFLKILEQNPSSEVLQRMGEMAWEHNLTGIAEQCYKRRFKLSARSGSFNEMVQTMEEMSFRGVQVPGDSLFQLCARAVESGEIHMIQRLIAPLLQHEDVPKDKVHALMRKLTEKLLAGLPKTRPQILTLKELLETQSIFQDLADTMDTALIQDQGQMVARDPSASISKIDQYVNVELLAVTANHVRMVVAGRQQDVPWMAVLGVFGCLQEGGGQGFKGCIILKYQRKVFGCYFQAGDIKVVDRFEQEVNFESLWEMIQRHAPVGMPIKPVQEFEELKGQIEFREKVWGFLKPHLS